MIELRTSSPSLLSALSFTDPLLQALVTERLARCEGEMLHIAIAQPEDTLMMIEECTGFCSVANRFGESDFEPSWESIDDHGDMFEVLFDMGDDGCGCILFVPDDGTIDGALVELCRRYTRV